MDKPMSPAARVLGLALASGVPLACYLASASAHGYWLDSGGFVAATATLGISHPPGHPVTALAGALAALVPLGPIALRVALAGALLAAVGAGALFLAIYRTVRTAGVASDALAVSIALGTTWAAALSYGWWFQAVRPEVYAPQAALCFVAFERVIALEASWPARDVRPLYTAALALGLALANNHVIAIMLLPALAPTLARVAQSRGRRPLLLAACALAGGFSTYIYLPLRAAAEPALNLGNPSSLSRFYWVVSAHTFQKNTGAGAPQPASERIADVAVQLVDSLHPVTVFLALCGAYAVLRSRPLRRVGYIWLMALAVTVGVRAWMGFVRSNPDALGYLVPAIGAAGALAAVFVAVVLARLAKRRVAAMVVGIAVAALGLGQLLRSAERASLVHFAATSLFDQVRLSTLPSRAIVLAHNPETIFARWGEDAESHERPDVTFVPLPFLGYPGMAEALAARSPELRELARHYESTSELPAREVISLAAQRPTLLDMDVRVPPTFYRLLSPAGLLYEVKRPGVRPLHHGRDPRTARRTVYRGLYMALAGDGAEPETRGQLVWLHYMDALYYAGTRQRDDALSAARAGRRLAPLATELIAIERALEAPRGGE